MLGETKAFQKQFQLCPKKLIISKKIAAIRHVEAAIFQ